jgi:outer membrane protein assembly factor BamA
MAFDSLLLAENPSYTVNYRKKLVFPSFYYKLKLDHRDIRYYPLHGWYADAEFYKAGFTNSGRGDAEFTWIKSTGRVFTQWKQRWYAGAGLTVRQNFGDIPYYYRQGLGYDRDFVRGYEYYVVDGKGYAVVRTTVKFAVVPHRVSRISRIPWEKFSKIHYAAYLTCFADAGKTWGDFYEGSDGNAIPGKWIAGTGLGLDLVTYYDKVVRIEYSVNRSGESGIFIHLIAGI